MKEKITHQIWFKGRTEDVSKVIESLKSQGFETIQDVCEGFGKKIIVFN